MKAWTLDSTDDHLRLSEVAEPTLRSGGALIDVLSVQIPAYTRFLTTGGRGAIPTPTVLGAGGVGRVRQVADDVFNVRVDDVVLATGLLASGRTAQPEEVLIAWTGIGGRGHETETTRRMRTVWRNGMFSERALMPAGTLVALPGAETYEPPEQLAFLPWLTIAAAAVERAGLRAGDSVAVIGATGQLGGAATLVALASGATTVVAVGRDAEALERLRRLSSRIVPVRVRGTRAEQTAAIVSVGGEVDVVIDALGAAPTPDPTLSGYDALRPDGTMVVLGGVRETLPIPYADLMRRRITLRGSWMAEPRTALAVWRLVQSGALDLSALRIRTVGLDEPGAALDLAEGCHGLDIVALTPVQGVGHDRPDADARP